jgi:uncharacterized Zn finger protein
MMRRGGFPEYESVASKRAKATASLAKERRKNPDIEPVIIEGRALAKSWWGKAWNRNLESYADYSNRIGRGKSYVRQHAVIDLKISKSNVTAKVQGSRAKPYTVDIAIHPLDSARWEKVIERCNQRIASLEELAAGKFPKELEVLFQDKTYGLFPSPKEIHFGCSCPDWAYMCKHVAASLYGIGARLDHNPMLFFELRAVDGQELIRKSMAHKIESMLKYAGKKSGREIAEEDVAKLFGL